MRNRWLVASLVTLLGTSVSAWASTNQPDKKAAVEKVEAAAPVGEEAEPEIPAADRPQVGPKKIDLGDDLVLDLPELYGYFDRVQGKKLMEKMGNQVDGSFRGLVFKKDAGWLIEIEYVGDGYVKDDDAADLKPDEILESIKEGTEEANEYRKEKGFPGIHVEGWTEAPHYDRQAHHLVWGIKGKLDDGKPASINFYTRVLGRRGYVAINLMDDPATIEASKADGLTVLRATTFKEGARYQDFDSKSDKVAEYGLAALVATGAGVTALKLAKVGILAKFSGKLLALILAGKKLLVLLIVGIGAAIKRFFGGKQEAAAAAPPSEPPAAGPPSP
jgi:uncharacterized membrane-anchored protein